MLQNWFQSKNLRLGALVAAAACAAYAGSLRNGFVFDDLPIVVESPLARPGVGVLTALASPYWRSVPGGGGAYRPVTMLSYSLNYRLGGPSPIGYHAANVALHAAVSVLLFLLLGRFGWEGSAAAGAALAFAVLPVHAEAVASVVGRAELLSAAFTLAAWLLAFEAEGLRRASAASVLFLLALLSKEGAAPFPLALVLSELAASSEPWREVARRRGLAWLLPFAALGLCLEWRSIILGGAARGGPAYFAGRSFWLRLLTMARFAYRGYLFPAMTGLGLCADRSRPSFPDSAATDPLAWLALASLLLLLAWALRSFWRERSRAGFSALLFCLLMSPVSNLLIPLEVIGAERLLYLPSIGLCMLFGLAFEAAAQRSPPAALASILAAVAWWTGGTIRRTAVWRTEESLWTRTAEDCPGSPRALIGLAKVAESRGRTAEARALDAAALKLDPAQPQALYNLGRSHFDAGEFAKARETLADALRVGGPEPDAYCLLALIAEKEGRPGEALRYLSEALEIDPLNPAARRDLGLLYYRLGRIEDGRLELERYLETAPPEESGDVRQFLARQAGLPAPPSQVDVDRGLELDRHGQ